MHHEQQHQQQPRQYPRHRPEAEQNRTTRARPFHRPGRIFVVLFFDLVLLALVAGCIWALYMVFESGGEKSYAKGFILFLGASIAVFIYRRIRELRISCPLCHGTILKTQSCRKHKDARRIFFLTYRGTIIFDILTRLKFTCIYCGTRFRLRR